MIRLSDNASADSIYARVGDEGLIELARAAGMKGFAVSGDWANATVTPADQARFFLWPTGSCPRRERELRSRRSSRPVRGADLGDPGGGPPPLADVLQGRLAPARTTASWCTRPPCSSGARGGWRWR